MDTFNYIIDVHILLTKFYSPVHTVLMQCESTNELVLLEILKSDSAPILFGEIYAIGINNNIKQAISKA